MLVKANSYQSSYIWLCSSLELFYFHDTGSNEESYAFPDQCTALVNSSWCPNIQLWISVRNHYWTAEGKNLGLLGCTPSTQFLISLCLATPFWDKDNSICAFTGLLWWLFPTQVEQCLDYLPGHGTNTYSKLQEQNRTRHKRPDTFRTALTAPANRGWDKVGHADLQHFIRSVCTQAAAESCCAGNFSVLLQKLLCVRFISYTKWYNCRWHSVKLTWTAFPGIEAACSCPIAPHKNFTPWLVSP